MNKSNLTSDLANSVTITGEPVSSAVATAGQMGIALLQENNELNRLANNDSPLKTMQDELRMKRNMAPALGILGPIGGIAGGLMVKRAKMNLKEANSDILSNASAGTQIFKKGGVIGNTNKMKAASGLLLDSISTETDAESGMSKKRISDESWLKRTTNKVGTAIGKVDEEKALAYGQIGLGLLGSLTSGDAPDLSNNNDVRNAYASILKRETLPGMTPAAYNEEVKNINAERAAITANTNDFNLKLASSIKSENAKLMLLEKDSELRLARQEMGDKVRLDLANLTQKSKEQKYAEYMMNQEADAALINAGITNLSDMKYYKKLMEK